LVELGIECTLSQLLDTGVMHADPHAGNLLQVELREEEGGATGAATGGAAGAKGKKRTQLAYLDFGLVSEVPVAVRDGLVCAVVLLVGKEFEKVADLFGELMLLPQSVLDDPVERAAFTKALAGAADRLLSFDGEAEAEAEADEGGKETQRTQRTQRTQQTQRGHRRWRRSSASTNVVPTLRFDRLLGELTSLAPRFAFQLPPYFLNNARALGTLEGMARGVDPNFSVLRSVYPFALRRMLSNPDGSELITRTLSRLTRASDGGVRWRFLNGLVGDAAALLGVRRRQLAREMTSTRPGRRYIIGLVRAQLWTWAKVLRRVGMGLSPSPTDTATGRPLASDLFLRPLL